MTEFQSFVEAIKMNSVKNFKKYFKKEFLERECDKNNLIAIHLACQQGSYQVLQALIKNKCNIEACTKDNWRPIHYACQNNHSKVLEILIKNKCDIEACTNTDYRAIHLACWNGHVDIVRILIEKKCDFEAVNLRNQSPLDLARSNRHQKIVDFINEVTAKNAIENPTAKNAIENPISKDSVESLISSMKLNCKPGCDHNFCSTSVRKKVFRENNIIGKGAFGIVCRVQESQSDRKFAMKVMVQEDENNSFEKNINNNLGNLNHERIVKYFGAIEYNQKIYIFMEFLPNGSLKDKINKAKPNLSSEMIIRFTKQILEGLAFLHEKNIIHRDIKPENVLLDKNKNLKLADFGLGRSLTNEDGHVTNAKTFCGTPCFMAIEIFKGEPYTTSADIWALGMTIINMDTGKPIFHNYDSYLTAIFEIDSLKEVKLPPMRSPLEDIVKKMLKVNSSERPPASELLNFKIFK